MSDELHQIEQDLLLEAIYRRYGYDFRYYAEGALRRRVAAAVAKEGLPSVSALQGRILRDPECMERFVDKVSIHVTAMFRDPEFFLSFRQNVVPLLRTYPFIRVWIAGCSSGEEIYSTAIILKEAGIYERCRIYATDIADGVLKRARDGVFPLTAMQEYTANYHKGGGEREFSTYYTANYDRVIFSRSLIENVTFAQHNLISDASFNEFNLILCRNVMIYFSKDLQEQVLKLFHSSLCRFGILGLGAKESLNYSTLESAYEEIEKGSKFYRRVK